MTAEQLITILGPEYFCGICTRPEKNLRLGCPDCLLTRFAMSGLITGFEV